jgi:hypothetical protein
VANISVNSADTIQFVNVETGPTKDHPTLTVQAGDWDSGTTAMSGIVVDVTGTQAPLLTPIDARKLSKWLARAADMLDGVKNSEKKKKPRAHYEEDDDEFQQY